MRVEIGAKATGLNQVYHCDHKGPHLSCFLCLGNIHDLTKYIALYYQNAHYLKNTFTIIGMHISSHAFIDIC